MHTIEEQLVETSGRIAEIVVGNIGNNQARFDETMELVYLDKSPMSMRAAWVAYKVVVKHPKIILPHIERLAKILPIVKVGGVKRLALKMLMDNIYDLSEENFGALVDTCFNFAATQEQPIAVRAFSLDILLKVMRTYPEIKPEIIAVAESMIPDGSRGIKNKCTKLVKKLKINNV